jgi:hypothetical protein
VAGGFTKIKVNAMPKRTAVNAAGTLLARATVVLVNSSGPELTPTAQLTKGSVSGDPLGNVQSLRCSGGSADAPTSLAPKSCTPIGTPIQASLAPFPVPFPPPT